LLTSLTSLIKKKMLSRKCSPNVTILIAPTETYDSDNNDNHVYNICNSRNKYLSTILVTLLKSNVKL
jgi:hypothetical protein